MKRFVSCCVLAFSATIIGCGGSSEPTNIMENADEAAAQSYDEMVAADEAAMSEDPGDAEEE